LRLHTARSRNDQVALDFRIYVVAVAKSIVSSIEHLQQQLVDKAHRYSHAVMPGYTHLQRAQPVFFSHALLAFHQMLVRDIERFLQVSQRAAVSPLGAGAQAGTGLSIDPSFSATLAGFSKTFSNSIDAVMDRDFAAEFLMASCLLSTHLSQIAETLIIWNTAEFGFVQFCDSVTTSSSLMPQKKNPDPVEIVRGKTGTAIGELVNLLVTLKGLPLGYNRDLQETKAPVIKVAKEVETCLHVMSIVIGALSIDEKKMHGAASDPNLMATDMVEYLVAKGVPFRAAHESVANAVQLSEELCVLLSDLPLAQLKECNSAFDKDVNSLFDPVASAAAKKSPGGTGLVGDVLADLKTKTTSSAGEEQ
jgi:argininosuccinate lyase